MRQLQINSSGKQLSLGMGIVATYFENKLRTENYFQNALNLAQSYELSIFFKGLEKIKVYYEGISTF